jgi:hypothetical protein
VKNQFVFVKKTHKKISKKEVPEMRNLKHTFSTVEDLVAFVVRAERCSFDIDVVYNQLVIDGKSLIGVMLIGIGKQVEIVCHNAAASPEELVGHAA